MSETEILGVNNMRSKYRLGIDAGGTFTDFVLADLDGGVRLYKSPSTPEDGTRAIRAGLEQISQDINKSIEDIIAQCDLCINGTTVALNALIEKKGVKMGLLCTSGHEDSIEIRLGHKEEGYRYDASYPPAEMLVPRHLRRPIEGRILSDGSEKIALDEQAIREAGQYFKEQNVESVAISFLWSVRDPSHEQRAKSILEEMLPGVFICTGSEVYPQVREYTRTSTTVINAYLSPVMAKYVEKIDDFFSGLGAKYPVRYFQSNGGLAIGSAMRGRAVNAINSGPASAPQAGLFSAAPFGVDNIITVDMGGTSFDITLTYEGQTNLNKNIDFLRYRIGVPMIQVETLGAGGGSIASVNEFGMLQVGPESAGATPGPVCYGKGGTKPTVTDANLVLGYLNPDAVLGGTISLDRKAAEDAIREHVADPLGITVEKAAYGISMIVNLNMVNGIRRVSIERGYDPRDFALVCAGGAAGMHIAALAEEIGIKEVLVPKVASGLCAFGQTISDVKYNYLATNPMRLDTGADINSLNESFLNIEKQGRENLLSDGFKEADITVARSMEMRYVGQIHECTVNISSDKIDDKGLDKILADFHDRHKSLYSYAEPMNPVELVNLESTMTAHVAKPAQPKIVPGNGDCSAALIGPRDMLFDDSGGWMNAPVYQGPLLKAGDCIQGPALIEEPTMTLVVRPGWRAQLEESNCYRLIQNE
ncbi:hydantoinase/oxoprolinase family protein [Dasania sp. GY-MA-18]|uniref:Hydantoinase/oxoprolinase family protein n=1 Tax=Dasania phycosphaerae TaxID=2950436 RepID=A0A9J6RL00_9GAMM|nr:MULTISPECIES: hydantoinase/oxoprolinase family protein [Dasania]MCR8922644.1 hydantoinase/oxoprolinase family protein [Dasania sp. GY-MA-18]MCZ0865074.1 hydantoinase/oxoprolinase family protein [Dasania phycosphaerae]MCZ0868800.1 hydantoinase/oxoprolinase family protein [Dasania phycosphaerae]